MILLDSDHLTVVIDERHTQHDRLRHLLESIEQDMVSTTIVCVEEQCRGWLGRIEGLPDVSNQVPIYRRLSKFFTFLQDWDIVPFDSEAAAEFAQLRKSRIRIGTYDLKIASIALANQATLLSANVRDFQYVPGLKIENWLE